LIGNAEDLIYQLYQSMYKKLVRAAMTKLRNYPDAEDITQDVFTLAEMKKNDLLTHPNPEGWLFDVLKNKILHEYRTRGRFKVALGKLEAGYSDHYIPEDDSVPDIFDCITKDEYDLLKRIYVDGYTIRLVAEQSGLNYETCRRRVQRIKDKVRNCGK